LLIDFIVHGMFAFVCFSTSERRHCVVPNEVAKDYQDSYHHPAGVKSSTALILECRPRSVVTRFVSLH